MSNTTATTATSTNEYRILTCVYCGHEYPQETPTWGHSVLTDHIAQCTRHPMRAVVEENKKLKAELEAIRSSRPYVYAGQLVLTPIKARLGAISPRPWRAQEQYPGSNRVTVEGPVRRDKQRGYVLVDIISDGSSIADAEFIVHAPEDIDALINEVERLQTRDVRWERVRKHLYPEEIRDPIQIRTTDEEKHAYEEHLKVEVLDAVRCVMAQEDAEGAP